MKDTERRRYETRARVRDFGATHAAAFPATTRGGELFAQLAATVAELDGHAEAQVAHRSAAAQGTTGKAAARDALRRDLEAISDTARALSVTTPGLRELFRLPRGNNDQALLSTARAFHTAAAPLKADFIRLELPADFLENLEADINGFGRASVGQISSRQARVAATNAIGTAIERGLAVLRQLDAVVRNKFRDDPATLAAWESASRAECTHRKARQPVTQSPAQ
ncbi:MAG: hypothetical protein ACJ741_03320 [Pyrinomonadaceae bacterium]